MFVCFTYYQRSNLTLTALGHTMRLQYLNPTALYSRALSFMVADC